MSAHKLPFDIVVLAPFHAVPEGHYRPRLFKADTCSIDECLAEMGPSLSVSLPEELAPSGWLDIRVDSMDKFSPDGLIAGTDYLRNINEAKNFIRESLESGKNADEIYDRLKDWTGLPIEMKHQPAGGGGGKPDKGPSSSSGAVDDILSMVAMPDDKPTEGAGPSVSGGPEEWADQLGQVIDRIMVNVFSHEDFRMYEASWRGLELLYKAGVEESDGRVGLRLCSVTMPVLGECLEGIEEELFDAPPSLIVVAIPFDSSPMALENMGRLAKMAETLLAPAVVSVNEKFFGLSRWDDLHKLPFVPNHLEQAQYAKWRKMAGGSAAEWIAVATNPMLGRAPYDRENRPDKTEFIEGKELWVSPSWAAGALAAGKMKETGWACGISGGMVIKAASSADTGMATAADMSEDRGDQMARSGIMPLVGRKGTGDVFFPMAVTASGASFDRQMLVSRIISLVLWAKDNFEHGMGPAETELNLAAAFGEYWESTGQSLPQDFSLSVTETNEGPYLLSISMTPDRAILPTGESIELQLGW